MSVTDALSIAYSTAKLVYKQSRLAKSNVEDCEELGDLVQRVEYMLHDLERQLKTIDTSQLAAVNRALEALRHGLDAANKVTRECADRNTVSAFLFAGRINEGLKDARQRLVEGVHLLSLVNVTLGARQMAKMRQLEADIRSARFEASEAARAQEAAVRYQVELAKANHADATSLLKDLFKKHLSGGIATPTSEVVQEEIRTLTADLGRARLNKDEAEEHYVAQIIAALAGDAAQRQGRGGAGGSSAAGGSASSSGPPDAFCCSITGEVMVDPMLLCATGHTYERSAIERRLATHWTDPMTNVRVDSKTLSPNHALRQSIQKWRNSPATGNSSPAAGSYTAVTPAVDLAPTWHSRDLLGHTSIVTSVALSADGRTAVSGSLDKTVKLWDVASGRLLKTAEGHESWVRCVAVSRDGRFVLSGSDDTVKKWDVATGAELMTFQGHADVNGLALSEDGCTVVSGSDDKTVKVWEWRTATC